MTHVEVNLVFAIFEFIMTRRLGNLGRLQIRL